MFLHKIRYLRRRSQISADPLRHHRRCAAEYDLGRGAERRISGRRNEREWREKFNNYSFRFVSPSGVRLTLQRNTTSVGRRPIVLAGASRAKLINHGRPPGACAASNRRRRRRRTASAVYRHAPRTRINIFGCPRRRLGSIFSQYPTFPRPPGRVVDRVTRSAVRRTSYRHPFTAATPPSANDVYAYFRVYNYYRQHPTRFPSDSNNIVQYLRV